MKLLVDEQLAGCAMLLRTKGWDVLTAQELLEHRDEDLVEYALKNECFVITEDKDMADICKFREVPYLHLDVVMKARIIDEELRRRLKT